MLLSIWTWESFTRLFSPRKRSNILSVGQCLNNILTLFTRLKGILCDSLEWRRSLKQDYDMVSGMVNRAGLQIKLTSSLTMTNGLTLVRLLHCGIFFLRINHCTSQPACGASSDLQHQTSSLRLSENYWFCSREAERKFSRRLIF